MCVFFFFVFFWLYTITACNILNELLFLYLHYSAFSFMPVYVLVILLGTFGIIIIIVMFISCLDYHSDGTHSLQRMHCYIYPNLMKKQTPLIQASLYDSFEAAFTLNKPMTSHGYALQASFQSEKGTDLARALPWASRSTVGTPRRTKRVKSDCSMFEYFWKAMFLMTGGNWWWSPIIIQRLSRL